MILEKSQPPPPRVATAPNPSQVARYGSFRDLEAELLKLAVDLGGSPIRVLVGKPPDQGTHLIGDLWPTTPPTGTPTPVETETGAVPADDSLGLDDDEDIAPA